MRRNGSPTLPSTDDPAMLTLGVRLEAAEPYTTRMSTQSLCPSPPRATGVTDTRRLLSWKVLPICREWSRGWLSSNSRRVSGVMSSNSEPSPLIELPDLSPQRSMISSPTSQCRTPTQ